MHPAICDKVDIVINTLINEYGEKPQWSGRDLTDGSGYVLLENLKEKSWTLIKFSKEYACILGVGGESKSDFGLPI
jgi:shikimate 5-dehydrogenase